MGENFVNLESDDEIQMSGLNDPDNTTRRFVGSMNITNQCDNDVEDTVNPLHYTICNRIRDDVEQDIQCNENVLMRRLSALGKSKGCNNMMR